MELYKMYVDAWNHVSDLYVEVHKDIGIHVVVCMDLK